MEFGSIERDLYIDASPEVVFEVVSSPEHIRDWWDAEADIDASAGSSGHVVFTDEATGRSDAVAITVVRADRPRLFSFRWTHPDDEDPTSTNSLLVTFELTPSGTGTNLRLTETGFRERGWEVAVLEAQYRDHVTGWDALLPRIDACARRLVASR